MNNVGLIEPVKKATAAYFLRGLDELLPITESIAQFNQRERHAKLGIVPSRMIDDVQEMIDEYRKMTDKGKAVHSPFPMIMLAFGKDSALVERERGRSVPDYQNLALVEGGDFYRVRMLNKSLRAQLVFMAHEHETLTAITDQLRAFVGRFLNHRYPVKWVYDGIEFETPCMFLEGYEPADNFVPIDMGMDSKGRQGVVIYTWDLTLVFPVPYVGAKLTHLNSVLPPSINLTGANQP